jgi:tetratricopeptide (TPR) repeat protein
MRSSAGVRDSAAGRKFRWKVPAIIAGVLVLTIAALAVWNITRRRAVLTAKDTVLLADFANTTGEAVFDGTLKQALAVQLGQSPYLNILPEERVNVALRFMGRPPNERITRDVAREICEREGIKAMIVGSIASLGTHYVVTLEAVNAHEGDSIAREQSEADSKEQVLKALGTATLQLREKLGESLASVKKFDAPIEQATTSSLDALKAFSQGTDLRNQGKQADSIAFYQRAIELDPNFALAYARLAATYQNLTQPASAALYAQKAYDLRDRVSERERYYISEKYTSYVTGDREEASRVLQAWEKSYPNDYVPHHNLAINYNLFGQHEEALQESREAVRLNPKSLGTIDIYISAFIKLNRFDEARETLQKYLGSNPDHRNYRLNSLTLAVIRNAKDIVKADLEWGAKLSNDPDILDVGAQVASYYGQWQKALDLERRAIELSTVQGRKETAAQFEAAMAFYAASFGRCDQAKATVARSLALAHGRWNQASAVLTMAMCNETAQLGPLTEDLQKRFPKDTGIVFFILPLTRALLESNRGNLTQAIDATQPAMRFELGTMPGLWLNYLRGQIFLKGKSGKEAAAEFQKILDHPGLEPFSPFNPLAHLGLARASVLTGDTVIARKEYQDFLAMWKDADSDLPILIEAKKEYEQVRERGVQRLDAAFLPRVVSVP